MRRSIARAVPRVVFLAALVFALSALQTRAQSSQGAGASAGTSGSQAPGSDSMRPTPNPPVVAHYQRPSESLKLRNFVFDAVGPYPFIGAIGTGGIQQAYGTPREWGEGWDAYGVRVASNFGIALTTTTARYTLAEVFREDTLYYRCDCKGFLPRLEHAVISTVTARRGEDGHREFSVPAFVAPYAGAETAALGWYPGRYGPKDGFRMGNYNLLGQMGQNIALEFVYGGPHTLLNSMHIPGLSGKGRAGPNP